MSKISPSVPKGFKLVAQKSNVTEYTLTKNGLTVLFAHVEGSPAVSTNIVYKVGSQDEGKGQTGLAHMLEHMLFKPTKHQKHTWKALEEKGALLNATTWLDRTMYYFSLPKEYLEDMLKVEAERMREVLLTPQEFLPERTNVLSEYQMYNSMPESALEWGMVGVAFGLHGYKHDTIGFKEDIERYTVEKLQAFYDTYYWPDNATLVVVGDIDASVLLHSIHKIFGSIKREGGPPLRESVPEPEQKGVRRIALERKTPVRNIQIAFKAPAFREKEWTHLNLALNYLTLGKTSVLYEKLVSAKLATSVEATLYPSKDPFLACITVHATEHTSYDQIESIVFTELHKLGSHTLSKKELSEIQEYLYSRELFSRDGTFSIAATLAEYVATGDWKRYFDELTEIQSTTPRDIKHAVSKYLVKSKATIGTIQNIS